MTISTDVLIHVAQSVKYSGLRSFKRGAAELTLYYPQMALWFGTESQASDTNKSCIVGIREISHCNIIG